MSVSRRLGLALVLVASVAVACGSTTSNDLFASGGGGNAATDAGASVGDDGGTSDGGGTTDGSVADASGGNDGGGGTDAGPKRSCAELAQDVDDFRPKAIECSIVSLDPQCDLLIEDICCKASISKVQRGTPQVKAFQLAVAAFKAAKCVPQCDAVPCRSEPSRLCLPQGLGAICQQ